jgi:hypothetical protein
LCVGPELARCVHTSSFQACKVTYFKLARCASQVLDRCARPWPAAPLVVDRRAVFIYRCAQAVARGGARCAPKVLDRCARPLPAAARR